MKHITASKIVINNFSTKLLNEMGIFVGDFLAIDKGFIVEKNEFPTDYHHIDARGLELLPAFIDLGSEGADTSELIEGGVGVSLAIGNDIDDNGFRAFGLKALEDDAEIFSKDFGFVSFEKDLKKLTTALHYLKSFDKRYFCFPYGENYGQMNDSLAASIMGTGSSDDTYEAEIIYKNLLAVEKTGVRANFEVSTKRGLALLLDAKRAGLDITISVPMMNLLFTDDDVLGFEVLAKVKPHLRSKSDIDFIVENFDYIDFLSIKHTSLADADKNEVFAKAKFGSANAYFILPMVFAISSRFDIPVSKILAKLSVSLSKMLGQKLSLSVGEPARIILADMEREILGDYQHLWSGSKKMGVIDAMILKNNIFLASK